MEHNYHNSIPQVVRILDSNTRLSPPPGCPRTIYELMIKCWLVEGYLSPLHAIIYNNYDYLLFELETQPHLIIRRAKTMLIFKNYYRDPTAGSRPRFRELTIVLTGNAQDVLAVPQKALDAHELAGVLGSPLEVGKNMYKDLQDKYCSESDIYYD
jgi:hypothetical protein